MESILGVIFHSIGGFASGSFYMPLQKSQRLVMGKLLDCRWIILLVDCSSLGGLANYKSGFEEIIKTTSPDVIKLTIFFGLLWGIGGLTYGLGVRYLEWFW